MIFFTEPELESGVVALPLWMQQPWLRFRRLPLHTLHHYFTSGTRTRPVKQEFRIRTREGETGSDPV